MNDIRRLTYLTSALLLCLSLGACDAYWWTRGQPPATAELVSRAANTLDAELRVHGTARADIAPRAKELRTILVAAADNAHASDPRELASMLDGASRKFLELEDSLSVGSRPAFAELSGQLRTLAADARTGKEVDAPALETFVSRVLFLLSSELTVPPPRFL